MRIIRIIGGILVFAGIVWALQGTGVIGGFPMSGHGQWLVIGVGCALVGFLMLQWTSILRYGSR